MGNSDKPNNSDVGGGFWTTLPGILTTLTGLIIAITGLIAGLSQTGLIKTIALPPSPITSSPTETSSILGNKKDPSPTTSPSPTVKNVSCEEQLSNKLGRYEGEAVLINSSTRRLGKVVIEISRETDASCRLIARVEELSPLAGKGILTGQFDPNVGQKVDLVGSLSHQTQPKVWDVEMNIQFINANSIEGRSTWKPKSDVEDTKTYYEEFKATKPF